MRIGLSLSPGGLLLPYHIGVLSGLSYYNQINNENSKLMKNNDQFI